MKLSMTIGRSSFADLQRLALRFAVGETGDLAVATFAPWAVVLTVVPEHHAFDGSQVWCASISRRGITNKSVPPAKWSVTQIAKGQDLLADVLEGVGDPERSRCLTTSGAIYVQRALRQDELDPRMSEITQDAFLPLGPLAILWARGLADRVSGLPCEAPVHRPLVERGPSFATDCGACFPCQARTLVRATGKPCLRSLSDFDREPT